MNDSELLAMAAKAVGAKWTDYSDRTPDHWELQDSKKVWRQWSPLTDDGDALRLAARLSISIRFWGATNVVGSGPGCEIEHWEPVGDDQLAATRRAIVRAAAEIGKAMP